NRTYEELRAKIRELQQSGRLSKTLTADEKIDWAFGNTVIENAAITREMVESHRPEYKCVVDTLRIGLANAGKRARREACSPPEPAARGENDRRRQAACHRHADALEDQRYLLGQHGRVARRLRSSDQACSYSGGFGARLCRICSALMRQTTCHVDDRRS